MPRMVGVPTQPHRQKEGPSFAIPAMIARPVGKKEHKSTPASIAAEEKEWKSLEDRKVWLLETVREWDEVAAEARRIGKEIHMGRIFGFAVVKHHELEQKYWKYKYRVVFQGNRVVTQNWTAAIFQDLGSQPASLEAGKANDVYGLLPGHVVEFADADCAYTQADLIGPETWIAIPRDRWPPEWIKAGYKNPVVIMKKALYGHPDSGTAWEKHADRAIVHDCGFERIPHWPACYWHPVLEIFLSIYVDDFKMAGPKDHLKPTWAALRKHLDLDPEVKSSENVYLGCGQNQIPVDRPC